MLDLQLDEIMGLSYFTPVLGFQPPKAVVLVCFCLISHSVNLPGGYRKGRGRGPVVYLVGSQLIANLPSPPLKDWSLH